MTTGINQQTQEPNLSVYPNPAHDILYLQYTNSNQPKKISLLNLLGQVVTEYPYSNQINISRLPDAIYIMRVDDAAGNLLATARMVKL